MGTEPNKFGDTFHAHLGVCEQCADHPFDLCPTGALLLRSSATEAMVKGETFAEWSTGQRHCRQFGRGCRLLQEGGTCVCTCSRCTK
jgi:hypothetical protein